MANKLIEQLTSDPDFLSLSEADQDAMYEELAGRNQPLSATRPTPQASFGRQVVNRILPVMRDPLKALARRANPITGTEDFLKDAAAVVPAATQTAESIPAEAGLALQRGKPREVLPGMLKAVTGRSGAQMGDIARESGVPILSSEPVASTLGFLATLLPVGRLAGKAAETGVASAKQTVGEGSKAIQKLMGIGRPSTLTKPNPQREALVSKVQQRLLRAPKLAGKEFEAGLEEAQRLNPTSFVDATEPILNLTTMRGQNPHVETVLQGAIRQAPISETQRGIVQNILKNPEAASNLSLPQAQAFKRVLQQALKQKFQQLSPEYLGAHLDLLEVWHNLRARELAAFPEMKEVLKGYATTLQNFRQVKAILKEGSLEPALLSNLKNNSQLIQAFRELATEDTLKLIGQLQKGTKLHTFLRRLGIGAAATVGTGALGGAVAKAVMD